MFNVMEVEPGKEALFIKFLNRANAFSSKVKSPVSLGPYQVDGQPIFIYTTHYGSVFRFLQVMNGMLFKGLSAMRSKATKSTSWTYCENESSTELPGLDKVYVLGIKGDVSHFLAHVAAQKGHIDSRNKMIYNARGKAWAGHYFAFAQSPQNYALIQDYAAGGGACVLFKCSRIPH